MIALRFDADQFSVKAGSYRVGPATALENFSLQVRAQEFKRRLSGNLYPTNGDEIRDKIPKTGNFVVSRKIDGEFCLLFYDGKTAMLVNPGGTVRIGLPCLTEAAELLKSAGVRSAVIAAEFHHRPRSDGRERVHDVIKVGRGPENTGELANLSLAFFNLVELDDDAEIEYAAGLEQLRKIFKNGKFVGTVDFERVETHNDVERLYEKWVLLENAEGVVAFGEAGGWKIKPTHTIDVAVIGFSESIDDRKGLLHDLLVGVVRGDGTFHILTRVGGGFTEKERRELFLELRNHVVPTNYTEVNSDHVAYEMVRPRFVIEMKCLDVIAEKTRGGEIRRMVLEWNENDARWTASRRLPFVSVISPQFVRLRDDKQPVSADVPIRQIDAIVPVPDIDLKVEDVRLPRSEILDRRVFVKDQGGKRMVRKFLIWKTNKEATREYLPFVVYSTDFSSGRDEVITRGIYPANTLEQAEQKLADLIEKGVKKGWEQVV